jgi:hypothetical protein
MILWRSGVLEPQHCLWHLQYGLHLLARLQVVEFQEVGLIWAAVQPASAGLKGAVPKLECPQQWPDLPTSQFLLDDAITE